MSVAGRNMRKVAKGGVLFTGGSLAGTFITFVSGIVVVRLIERAEYGLLSLTLIMVNMFVLLSMLGFRTAVPRFMAQYRAEMDTAGMGRVAGTALACGLAVGSTFAVALWLFAQEIALFFDKPGLSSVISIAAFTLPAATLVGTMTAIFRGLEDVRTKVVFEDLIQNGVRLLLLVAVLITGATLMQVAWIYVISVWLALSAYGVYAIRRLREIMRPSMDLGMAKELVWFSAPLLGVSIMGHIGRWVSTMTLGYMKSAEEVGLFSAPMRLASFLTVPLNSVLFIYLPVVSKLVKRGRLDEIADMYRATTKWAFIMTLPVLIYFFFEAEFIVTTLFGPEYADSSGVLQAIVMGMAVHTFVGPNGSTLVAFGEVRMPFVASMLAAGASVGLCFLMIPEYGAIGAAGATALGRATGNVFLSAVLYYKTGIHALCREYLVPVIVALGVSGALAVTIEGNGIPEQALLGVLIFMSCFSAPMVTGSLSGVDLEIIGGIEKRVFGKRRLSTFLERRMVVSGTEMKGRDQKDCDTASGRNRG